MNTRKSIAGRHVQTVSDVVLELPDPLLAKLSEILDNSIHVFQQFFKLRRRHVNTSLSWVDLLSEPAVLPNVHPRQSLIFLNCNVSPVTQMNMILRRIIITVLLQKSLK